MYRYGICFFTYPLLGHRNRYLTSNCIRNCETCLCRTRDSTCISLYGNFLHRVLDFMSIYRVIFVQFFKFTLPMVCCTQSKCLSFFAIYQQFHIYSSYCWSYPLLFNRDRYLFCICVCDLKATSHIACDCWIIVSNLLFFYCIDDFMSVYPIMFR